MQEDIETFKEALRLYSKGNFGRTIDGSSSSIAKCCGYCKYDEHRGFLTESQRRQHNCLGNSCNFYLPKINEGRVKTKRQISSSCDDKLPLLNKALKRHEGMKILKLNENFDGTYEASYTAISNYDEKALIKEIEEKCGLKVNLKKLPYSFNNAAEIIFKGK